MSYDRSLIPVRLDPADASSLQQDAYGLPTLPRSNGASRMPDAFRSKRWEKSGHRKKTKKQLGQKVGYTLHHWRLKQKETHDKLIKGATSYVGGEMRKHEKIYKHNLKVCELAAKNKMHAMRFAAKHREKNLQVERKRLAAVRPHFTFKQFEHDYREHAHKMKTQATVDDQWMPRAQRIATMKYKTPSELREEKSKRMRRKKLLSNGRGHGSRPNTVGGSRGRRRKLSGSPGSRIVSLDEFLQDGMSSVMPVTASPPRSASRTGTMVLLNSNNTSAKGLNMK